MGSKRTSNDPLGRVSSSESYYDLGSHGRRVDTSSEEAQAWFNRGLIWLYAFNHEEAICCFEQAIAHDMHCAMAYWGLAYSLGPNYNKPWEFFDHKDLESTLSRAHEAAAKAQEIEAKSRFTGAVDKRLIRSLQYRYPQELPPKDHSLTTIDSTWPDSDHIQIDKPAATEMAKWNQRYAMEIALLYGALLDQDHDLDLAALYADALMNLTPWALWDIKTGEPAKGARTMEAKRVLEKALAKEGGMDHPGLLHLYIHLMEMSSTPEAALPMADRLRDLVPDAGHLQHMPTHIDILCGDYTRAMTSNAAAIRADEKYFARSGPLKFYTLYRSHNYHFRIYAAMFAGQLKPAMETCNQLEKSIPAELLHVESPPMADWLEGFHSVPVHVLVRFGRWKEIRSLELPQDQALYCVTTAMVCYAKCVAYAATGDIEQAEAEQVAFEAALRNVPESRMLFNNKCVDILAIAHAMLQGELEYRRGNFDSAFEHLRHAIDLDDNLPYDEPWGWMQPTRHAYGALLLEQGRVEEAAKVYAADLGVSDDLPRAMRHPDNVWALHGYHECLVKLDRGHEAQIIRQRLDTAMATADVEIRASCCCRQTE